MINWISGEIIHLDLKFAVIKSGEIGYKVFLTPDGISRSPVGTNTSLWIHHAIKEDSQELYGFNSREELILYELLLTISGVGPKTAMNILSAASSDTIREAVVTEDPSYLTKVSGIGKKVADKIVLELKDKFGESDLSERTGKEVKDGALAVEALKSLGYSEKEARDAVKQVGKDGGDTQTIVKKALKIISS